MPIPGQPRDRLFTRPQHLQHHTVGAQLAPWGGRRPLLRAREGRLLPASRPACRLSVARAALLHRRQAVWATSVPCRCPGDCKRDRGRCTRVLHPLVDTGGGAQLLCRRLGLDPMSNDADDAPEGPGRRVVRRVRLRRLRCRRGQDGGDNALPEASRLRAALVGYAGELPEVGCAGGLVQGLPALALLEHPHGDVPAIEGLQGAPDVLLPCLRDPAPLDMPISNLPRRAQAALVLDPASPPAGGVVLLKERIQLRLHLLHVLPLEPPAKRIQHLHLLEGGDAQQPSSETFAQHLCGLRVLRPRRRSSGLRRDNCRRRHLPLL
mmetsp:Transcript_68155/g.197567  ORF Transcript_68155/g.197567 Transcript_68155/m.197567 type:complete len:322 (-) Transcript_68155:699-1664(-)